MCHIYIFYNVINIFNNSNLWKGCQMAPWVIKLSYFLSSLLRLILYFVGSTISDIVSNKLTGMHDSLPGGPMTQIMWEYPFTPFSNCFLIPCNSCWPSGEPAILWDSFKFSLVRNKRMAKMDRFQHSFFPKMFDLPIYFYKFIW